jgi:hypothetical protein
MGYQPLSIKVFYVYVSEFDGLSSTCQGRVQEPENRYSEIEEIKTIVLKDC